MCARCLYDTSIPEIQFDVQGVCNFCKVHDEMEKMYPLDEEGRNQLERIVEKIKRAGRGKEYDCVVGVSGGRDSTYTMYKAVKLGLRPLAVHFDNGWNSEVAVSNIKKTIAPYNIDLVTVVADWEEFKDLQRAFFKSDVIDLELLSEIISEFFKLFFTKN